MSDVDSTNHFGHAAKTASDFNRTPIYLALILAVIAVLGAIVGARVVFDRAAHQPIALATIDAPKAESAACRDLLGRLPDSVAGWERTELADPAPAGAAAWARTSQDRATLRCGVHFPEQYTRVSTTEDTGGVRWLRIADPDSTLNTWYAVNRSPTVAVTAEGIDPTEAVAEAVAGLSEEHREPHSLPFDDVATPEGERCAHLMRGLPEDLGGRALVEKTRDKAVWSAPGSDPLELACGVAMPEAYAPGKQLTQINGIDWLHEGDLFYALGREVIVAASIPSTPGNGPLVDLSAAIGANLAAAEGSS
ncbi:DUF3515 domain-containing protein [Corynebacterium sp. zg-331]|uniref:DUF3515 domain-containing protein n=1 Tax=unclassified Corynebacterium TaxID=2624378 RepID=UPI00128CA6C2|nr:MULTISPECIES: DUF3515 domain-containing protein [unclassified Corynebacterium]MBC3186262.1 DUF3515 domain-containing protein [Corynebacterium sp. zg-331]MPV52749.1 DUF3515 family protein [Corynebacterium sp. zg331]